VINPRRRDRPDWTAPELAYTELIRRRAQLPLHRALPGYAPTPLKDLPDLAAELGLGRVLVKDEGSRFGIQAFKALGASFAMYTVLHVRWRQATGGDLAPADFADPRVRATLGPITFCAATDGNHGRAVAWTARQLGQPAVIFMPDDTVRPRIEHIEREGGEVRLVAGTFDDCVAACAETAAREGWQVIADTGYPGYLEIPGYIMTGYSTIFVEVDEQAPAPPDVVLVPAGVGGLAGAAAVHYKQDLGPQRPQLVGVEPEESACFLESIAAGDGLPHAAAGNQRSVMAGLNCGMPSLLAWPVVRDTVGVFVGVEDAWAEEAMRVHWRHGTVSGESGAATLAGLLALLRDPALAPARDHLHLGPHASVLVINTESDTDPGNWARITGATKGRP